MRLRKCYLKKLLLLSFSMVIVMISADTLYASAPLSSSGPDVRRLQETLIQKAYLNDVADGYYGAHTEQAVKAFQEDNGLQPTGIADEQTLKLLFPDTMSTEEGSSTVSGIINGYTNLQSLFLNLSTGMTENEVISLGQKYGMNVYNSNEEYTAYRYVYMSTVECNRYVSGSDEYFFDGYDSVEVVIESRAGQKATKVYYHFGTTVNGIYYSVEKSVYPDPASKCVYDVVHGYVSADPSAKYQSAQEALDAALALYS